MITLPEMPPRIARLPRDSRGYPVPWFVHWADGVPDFRVIGLGKWAAAARFERCWLCGEPRGRNFTFVIGPMCAINRTSGEPPCHFDCALFAAKACPFLTRPKMRRNEKDLPGERFASPGMSHRNPGACGLWTTRSFRVIRGLAGEPLAEMGSPTTPVLWFCEGREAVREEVLDSMTSGMLILGEAADREATEEERAAAHVDLQRQFLKARELAPP